MVATKQKLQREVLCVALQSKGKATNSVLYPQYQRNVLSWALAF